MENCSFCKQRPQVLKIGDKQGICEECAKNLNNIYDESMTTQTDDIQAFGEVQTWGGIQA